MRKLKALLFATSFGVVASQAGAATLSLSGSTLGISVGALPPLSVPQSPDPFPIFVSSGTGGFTEPAGLFGPATIAVPKALFTGVASISGLTLTGFANSTKVLAAGAGLPATAGKPFNKLGGATDFGGNGALSGNALVNVLQLFNLAIPLNAVGTVSGFVTAAGGAIKITVTATNWTTGVVQITKITTGAPTPNGGTVNVNTATVSGFDNRTPGHQGQIQLISPFHVITNVAGNLPGFAIQVLNFVPEAGTLLLLGTGAVGLALYGSRKLRK
jgi:hypothetical protein